MDEYVSREEVLKKFLERGSGYINELTMRDMINEIPAADVQPVRYGRWVECCNELDKKCSCCNKVHGTIYEREPFCPNCGARMNLKDGDING